MGNIGVTHGIGRINPNMKLKDLPGPRGWPHSRSYKLSVKGEGVCISWTLTEAFQKKQRLRRALLGNRRGGWHPLQEGTCGNAHGKQCNIAKAWL